MSRSDKRHHSLNDCCVWTPEEHQRLRVHKKLVEHFTSHVADPNNHRFWILQTQQTPLENIMANAYPAPTMTAVMKQK